MLKVHAKLAAEAAGSIIEQLLVEEIDYRLQAAADDMESWGKRLIDSANQLRDWGMTRGVEGHLGDSFNQRYIGWLEEAKAKMDVLGKVRAVRHGAVHNLSLASVRSLPDVHITVTSAEERLLNEHVRALGLDEGPDGDIRGTWNRKVGRGYLQGLSIKLTAAVQLRDHLRPLGADVKVIRDIVAKLDEAI